jgi:hypothetical protein
MKMAQGKNEQDSGKARHRQDKEESASCATTGALLRCY